MAQAKHSLRQQGADLERIAQSVGYSLEKVIKGVAGFFGLVLTFEGFKNLVVDAAHAGTTMGRFAESIGKTVEMTQAYRQAFSAFTGGETGILQTIRRMKLDLEAVPKLYTPWMEAVGQLTNESPIGKEPEQILQELADAIARRRMSAAQAIMRLKQSLPLTEEDILLLSKPGGLRKALEEQRKLGTPTTPQVQAMERLHGDIANIKTVNNLLELQTLTLMEPFLHELFTMTIRIFHWMSGIAKMLGLPSLGSLSTVSPAAAVVAPGGGMLGGQGSAQRSLLSTGTSRRTVFNPNTGKFETSTVPAGPRPMESGGGSAGITAPAGTPIQHGGMTTITTPSGKQFQVDERYAANFKGFLTDYENAGGVLGPDTDTLGFRPSNASGHPIGTAVDVNQIGYGERSRRGVTLPVETENMLAEKWGLTSGANWRRPDTGHFGIRSPEAAQEALQRLGILSKVPQSSVGGAVRGSMFSDVRTASGMSAATTSGISLPVSAGGKMGDLYEITTPDGRKFVAHLIDRGPAKWTGRGLDVSSPLAKQMGYDKDFPTEAIFGVQPYRPPTSQLPNVGIGAAAAAQSFDANRPKIENNETSTHVNQVIVHTNAVDASGIAQDVKAAIGKHLEAPVEAASP